MKKEIIQRISIYRCPVKLKEPFIISLGRIDSADNVLVRIETSGGIVGFGECSPFRSIHGETGETCLATGKIFAAAILGMEAHSIEACINQMDAALFGNHSIKSAFEIALFDIAACAAGLPLYKFLGGKENRLLFTDYTVSLDTVDKMAGAAKKIIQDGFKFIKVKLGGSEEEDVARLEAIRKSIGKKIPLRIDANQGWQVESAISILKRIRHLGIQHCEEPVSRKLFMHLPAIRKESTIPIMADESCFDHFDAERLIAMKACDRINVKLGKSGIWNGLRIIALAEKASMSLQAGGFLESRLGFTAAAHVALSSESFEFIDFDTPLMFQEDFITGGICYGENGAITVPEFPGLGATVDEAILSELERNVVEGAKALR